MRFLLLAICLPALHAQFSLWNRPVQVHGFVSQGYAKSDANNYLTMNTKAGSFAFTDGAINASAQINGRLRVGAQLYVRNIGELGNGRPTVDWAVIDYKFNDSIGLRGGKVKTVFGLYNDTQDMESLHTWAVLPQSIYALDLRSSTIAHLGGDLYGEATLPKHGGSLAFTAYAGRRFDDKYGGYRNVALQGGVKIDTISGWMAGGDLRWSGGVPGLTLGASLLRMPFTGKGKVVNYDLHATFTTIAISQVYYADYVHRNLHVTSEFTIGTGAARVTGIPGVSEINEELQGWYASAAYRVHAKLELGTYHSRYIADRNRPWDDPGNHVYDQTLTARVDLNRHWSVKVEGHIIDGYGSLYSARGFYLRQNPSGYERKTNLFVVRTGYTF